MEFDLKVRCKGQGPFIFLHNKIVPFPFHCEIEKNILKNFMLNNTGLPVFLLSRIFKQNAEQ